MKSSKIIDWLQVANWTKHYFIQNWFGITNNKHIYLKHKFPFKKFWQQKKLFILNFSVAQIDEFKISVFGFGFPIFQQVDDVGADEEVRCKHRNHNHLEKMLKRSREKTKTCNSLSFWLTSFSRQFNFSFLPWSFCNNCYYVLFNQFKY